MTQNLHQWTLKIIIKLQQLQEHYSSSEIDWQVGLAHPIAYNAGAQGSPPQNMF